MVAAVTILNVHEKKLQKIDELAKICGLNSGEDVLRDALKIFHAAAIEIASNGAEKILLAINSRNQKRGTMALLGGASVFTDNALTSGSEMKLELDENERAMMEEAIRHTGLVDVEELFNESLHLFLALVTHAQGGYEYYFHDKPTGWSSKINTRSLASAKQYGLK